jgi:hypothetical protein
MARFSDSDEVPPSLTVVSMEKAGHASFEDIIQGVR